jgi:hypothetical protein
MRHGKIGERVVYFKVASAEDLNFAQLSGVSTQTLEEQPASPEFIFLAAVLTLITRIDSPVWSLTLFRYLPTYQSLSKPKPIQHR